MFGKNYEEQFEKWLKAISEKLAKEEIGDFEPKAEQQVQTHEFTRQVAIVLRDEFVADITLLEHNHIRIKFSNDNAFILKIIKL